MHRNRCGVRATAHSAFSAICFFLRFALCCFLSVYHGAQLYFALCQIADGEPYDYLSLSEDGRHFDGIYNFDRFRYPVMPETEEEYIDDDFDPMDKDSWKELYS